MAASTVENNTDLLSQILIFLPVKSLMRFKCVSKRWLSHITNPCFTRSHTLHHYTPFPSHLLHPKILTGYSCFLTMPRSTENTVPSIPFITDFQFLNHEHLFIEKSCNGLLLIKASSPNCYYVCNPLTKQFLAFDLPSSPEFSSPYSPYSQLIYLAFDPMRSPHYKLIVMLYCELSPYKNPHKIHVYSSKTQSWTDFGISFPYDGAGYLIDSNGVYCNGTIYWYINDLLSLCFDVENQCFKRFPLPKDGAFDSDAVFYFGESGGHLHMILHHPDDNSWLLDIFELKEDSSGWSLRFHVNLGQSFPRLPHIFCVFCQKKEEDSVLMFETGDQIILYNLLDRTFRRLIDFDNSLSLFDQVLRYAGEVLHYSQNLFWDGDTSAF